MLYHIKTVAEAIDSHVIVFIRLIIVDILKDTSLKV